MTQKLATLTNKDNISIITLDDGKANVFSLPMIEDINRCLDFTSQTHDFWTRSENMLFKNILPCMHIIYVVKNELANK